MSDQFSSRVVGLSDPARSAAAIAPHDSNAIDPLPRSVFVGGAGNLTFRAADSDTDVTVAVPQGVFPVRCEYIRNSGTTATGLVALW